MLSAVTAEHPERRGRAIVLTAAALAAALGLSWLLSAVRSAPPELGPRVELEDWPVTFQLPDGWAVYEDAVETRRWSGEATATGRFGHERRGQVVVRYGMYPGATADFVADDYLRAIAERVRPDAARVTPVPIGPINGTLVEAEYHTPFGTRQVSVGAGVLPDGHAVLLAMFGEGRAGAALRRTFRDLCRSVEFVEPRLTRSPERAAVRAGLRCDPVSGAWAVEGGSRFRPVLSFVSAAEGGAAWSLEAWPTFLIAPRRLEDLAADLSLRGTLNVEPGAPVESLMLGDRAAARVARRNDAYAECVWTVSAGADRAILIRAGGRAPPETIDEACRRLAATVRFEQLPEEFDDDEALAVGRRLIEAIHRDGIDARWPGRPVSRWYLYQRHGEACGYYIERRRRTTDADTGATRLTGSMRIERRTYADFAETHVADWITDPAGDAFEWTERISVNAPAVDRSRETKVRREAGSEAVELEAFAEDQEVRRTLAVGPGFACKPMLEEVIVRCGSLPPDSHVIVQVVDGPAPAPHYVHCWRAVDEEDEDEAAVFVQSDVDPSPILFVYDRSGELRRIALDEDVEFVRSTRGRVERELRWLESR